MSEPSETDGRVDAKTLSVFIRLEPAARLIMEAMRNLFVIAILFAIARSTKDTTVTVLTAVAIVAFYITLVAPMMRLLVSFLGAESRSSTFWKSKPGMLGYSAAVLIAILMLYFAGTIADGFFDLLQVLARSSAG